jgi:archaellum component FlaC
MGLFKKGKTTTELQKQEKSARLFNEAIKEINELYDDMKSDYEQVENLAAEFEQFVSRLSERLDEKDVEELEDFLQRLNRMDANARNSIRDINDIIRLQKKRLSELLNDL